MSNNNNSDFSRPKNGTRSPEVIVTQSNSGSNSGMFLIIAAVVVALAAYFIYASNWSASPTAPSITQNTVLVPAPTNAKPDPATAPVAASPNAATAPAAPKASPATPDATKPVQ
jgi:hypothetical protein